MPEFQVVPHKVEIRARPVTGLWTLAHPFIEGPALLRIRADFHRWAYAPGREAICDANGDPQALVHPDVCLTSKAAVGALIGKFGGSTAGIGDAPIFVAGQECVVRVPDEGGALFLTINDTVDGMTNNHGSAFVEIAVAAVKTEDSPAGEPSGIGGVVAEPAPV